MKTSAFRSGTIHTQGFTLIEILVSISLIGILAAVLTATLTGTLNLNRQSQRQMDSTSQAHQVIESIRGAWAIPAADGVTSDYYNRVCAPSSTVKLNGLSAQYINLNSRAQPINSSGAVVSTPSATAVRISSDCATQPAVKIGSGTTAQPYPMRRLIVSSGTGPQSITLTLDLLRPE